jgi:transcriptional regulator with XRE-family HTH domain
MITPEQCRAARALLNWSQGDLREKTKVSQKTISDFELGLRKPYDRTLLDIRRAFEDAGVIFFDPEEGIGGSGARLKWEAEAKRRAEEQGETDDDGESGLKALDADLIGYWADHQEQWAKLSPSGRQVLSNMMFGSPYAADEAFGNDAR